LAAEYAWARLWLRKFRKMADDIQNKAENQVNKWRGKQEVK